MKGTWAARTLGEVYDVRDGTHESPKYTPQGFPLVTSKNLQPDGRLDLTNVSFIAEGDFNKINERSRVHRGDVLFAMIGTIGNPTVVTIDPNFAIKNVALFKVPVGQNSDFLKYFLESDTVVSKMAREAKGTTQKFVGLGYLRQFPINIPPLLEQQRIVAILDEAFAAIATAKANAEKNLQNARALFERTRDTEFTQCTGRYGTVRIDALCESIMDCVNKTAPKVDGPTEYKMVRTTNIRHGRISLSDVYYVTEEVFTQWTRRQQPTKGDVLLTREAPLGELGMIETDDKIFLGQRIVSYRANPTKLDSKFLLFGMQSAELQNQMKAKASGATVQHMRVPDTKTLQFPSVPLSEQKRLVQKLVALADMTQILESLCRRKLTALDELKNSLLHRAFNGDL